MDKQIESTSLKISKLIEKTSIHSYLSYTQAGELLGKKGSVISQYAKAGLVHPIQQGPKKIISMNEVYLLQVYMHAVKNYGCSYVGCKILGALLKETGKDPSQYFDYIKSLDKKLLTEEEIAKNVNSYENRGICQKKKIVEPGKDFFRSGPNPKTNRSGS